MVRLPSRGQVGHDFADDAAELESVAGKAGREIDVRKPRHSASMMKCSSGVFVNMQAFSAIVGPFASGK